MDVMFGMHYTSSALEAFSIVQHVVKRGKNMSPNMKSWRDGTVRADIRP